VRFAFLGGLAPGVRTHCRQSGSVFMDGAGVPYDEPCEDAPRVGDMRAYPARFDLGLVLGVTLAVESPIGIFEVEARSERGLVAGRLRLRARPSRPDRMRRDPT
jgi:hypothetical protein